ncbi:MAG: SAM-dependent methyltransferase [Prolixibacteraceae bacterium]|nr:SAM-dependent methyltransferase [Prolixibacteraceae bacterium]MBN2648772.1 SAM-dependent methyltransferase [Prolixibacteraceae bacterium]
MYTIDMNPIGIVKNNFDKPAPFNDIKAQPSTIVIYDEYAEALTNIDEVIYLDIVFNFHLSHNDKLAHTTYFGDFRGVFASRSPFRPNLIGVTRVKLVRREGNHLLVEGLDAINNSPVLDIKSSDTSHLADNDDTLGQQRELLKKRPRMEIEKLIAQNDMEGLMIKAAQIHGHFCPGLAMGIMAATQAMRELKAQSDGMEDLLAITETNNCMADGIQFVTGCTFGNNALIFNDVGKNAFTLTHRNGKGIRIVAKPGNQATINDASPDFKNLYQKVVAEQNHDEQLIAQYKKVSLNRSFGTLQIPFDMLFTMQQVDAEIPSYAPMFESVVCSNCGESVMSSRAIKNNDGYRCYSCNNSTIRFLDGHGIH